MTWLNPLPLQLLPTEVDAIWPPEGCSFLPMGSHPGAWGVQRSHHIHEGIDLYAPGGTPVFAVEDGDVTAVKCFTGPAAGLPWWLPTEAVWVEGASGVVLYGEITPAVQVGARVVAGQLIGHVARVLRHFKNRPTAMLHLELHTAGTTEAPEWYAQSGKPATLQDPTPLLLACVEKTPQRR